MPLLTALTVCKGWTDIAGFVEALRTSWLLIHQHDPHIHLLTLSTLLLQRVHSVPALSPACRVNHCTNCWPSICAGIRDAAFSGALTAGRSGVVLAWPAGTNSLSWLISCKPSGTEQIRPMLQEMMRSVSNRSSPCKSLIPLLACTTLTYTLWSSTWATQQGRWIVSCTSWAYACYAMHKNMYTHVY